MLCSQPFLIQFLSVRLQPKPSQVKSKTGCKSATALPILFVTAQPNLNIIQLQGGVTLYQLDCNPSQVKSNLRLVASLLLHCLFFFHVFFSLLFFLSAFIIRPLPLNSQPIWAKLWILNLMINPN